MVTLEQVPQLMPMAFGAVALALAGALVALRFDHPASRAFALLLALRGMVPITYGLGLLAPTPAAAAFWWRVFPYFALPLAFAALAFLAAYPKPRTWVPRRFPTLPFWVASAALLLAYAGDHRLFWDLAARSPGAGPQLDAPAGPLFAFDALFEVAYAVVAVVLARDYARAPPGPARRSALLVSLGFALVVVFDGLSILAFSPTFAGRHTPPLAWVMTLSLGLAVALVAALGVGLAAFRARSSDPEVRRATRRYLLVLPWPALSVALLLLLPAESPRLVAWPVYLLSVAWRLALPALVAYALVRHRIFDIDLKLRWTIQKSTVAGAFVAMFFVVTESVQQLFAQTSLGPYVGIVAAGLLVLVLTPLQQAGERVAAAALPHARPVTEMPPEERAALYREQAELAWADGALSRKEQLMLERLRHRLRLTPEDAARLEREVMHASTS